MSAVGPAQAQFTYVGGHIFDNQASRCKKERSGHPPLLYMLILISLVNLYFLLLLFFFINEIFCVCEV